MQPQVSVIIPVYNKENYLRQSVESVMGQTVKELEILLIDDGSTDGSLAICEELAKEDGRIRVIHKANEGPGVTRNLGIRESKGKYISFVDADDYIALNTYEVCIKKLKETGADLCYFGRNIVSKGEILSHAVRIEKEEEYEGEAIRRDFVNYFLGNLPSEEYKRNYVTGSTCCSLFDGDFIRNNKIFFPQGEIKYSEDSFFNFEICRYAQHILVLPDMLYYNNVNQASGSRRYRPDRFDIYKMIYHRTKEYMQYFPEDETADLRIDFSLALYVCKCVKAEVLARKEIGLWAAYKNIKRICKDEATQYVTKKVVRPGIGSKRNILLKLVLHKQALVILLYYLKH